MRHKFHGSASNPIKIMKIEKLEEDRQRERERVNEMNAEKTFH